MTDRTRTAERVFRFALWAKALNGALELAGGILQLLTSSPAIQAFVARITVHELTEDPTDVVAHAVLSFGRQLGAPACSELCTSSFTVS